MLNDLQPGQILARGVSRHLHSHGFVTLQEFSPIKGLRADVMALGPRGEFWLVECKSSRNDFQTDRKWAGYLEWCDEYFWAVNADFPTELLPMDSGLIIADRYDAEIIRRGTLKPLAAGRRKALMLRFASAAARRLQRVTDPDAMRSA